MQLHQLLYAGQIKRLISVDELCKFFSRLFHLHFLLLTHRFLKKQSMFSK